MLPVPDLDNVSVIFGDISHMPAYDTLPEAFRKYHGNTAYHRAVSSWFFKGAQMDGDNIVIDGVAFKPKPGVNSTKALRAIKAVLSSFEPKHEHKEAACAFMLSEWFEVEPPAAAA